MTRRTGQPPVILCIGAVLWDVIGRSERAMGLGHDVPGRIKRLPGGVSMNIAMACRSAGLHPKLLAHLGRDTEGRALAAACDAMGLDTLHVTWSDTLPTDQYMAIEAQNGLIAAIADAHSLEAAGDGILTPLADGTLGSAEAPYRGWIALDGNLTETVLSSIAGSALFSNAELRIAPASPGKVGRLRPLFGHPKATLYLNRIEAGLLADRDFADAEEAALALRDMGATRVLVTDGAHAVAEASDQGLRLAMPPPVVVYRITGAGDTFMAHHIAAEALGQGPEAALVAALEGTARFVSEPLS